MLALASKNSFRGETSCQCRKRDYRAFARLDRRKEDEFSLRFRDLCAGNAFDEHVSRQKRWFHGRRWSNV